MGSVGNTVDKVEDRMGRKNKDVMGSMRGMEFEWRDYDG